LLLIGPPGVGKTMLATILGHRAVEAGYRVYYTTAAELVARTAKAAIEGRWANTMRFWNGPQLLIVDELGYLPLADDEQIGIVEVALGGPEVVRPRSPEGRLAERRATGRVSADETRRSRRARTRRSPGSPRPLREVDSGAGGPRRDAVCCRIIGR
jgi:hypothetical protein